MIKTNLDVDTVVAQILGSSANDIERLKRHKLCTPHSILYQNHIRNAIVFWLVLVVYAPSTSTNPPARFSYYTCETWLRLGECRIYLVVMLGSNDKYQRHADTHEFYEKNSGPAKTSNLPVTLATREHRLCQQCIARKPSVEGWRAVFALFP